MIRHLPPFTYKPGTKIFLCGMMGSSKSTVGKELASKLGAPFSDLDTRIEEKAGISIPEIFESEGEPGFRKIEQDVLLLTAQTVSGIISLGGGALQNQHITDHIKLQGWLIFLDVPIKILAKRLQSGEGRPMVSSQEKTNMVNRLELLMEQRRPLYEQAHITIRADEQPPEEIATLIIKKLTLYNA